jgi:multisubunit Na+/H+ antiporter MnhB subunit
VSAGMIFDGLLVVITLWLAWASLASRDLFRGIVLFIAFGLVLAMIWVRLGAPDVGLAEAAIGAGLTGALLLATWGRLPRLEAAEEIEKPEPTMVYPDRLNEPGVALRIVVGSALVAVTAAIGMVLLAPAVAPGLTETVGENLAVSGAENPVTAVLLNFRGYDTLLEIAVLTAALVGVWALGPAPRIAHVAPSPVLLGLNATLLPLLFMICAYLLWAGKAYPGGAFQAGAVLAAAGVLMILSGGRPTIPLSLKLLRWAAVVGLAVFLGVALALMSGGRNFLQYPEGMAGGLILFIEIAATVSIAVILALMFVGGRPEDEA